MRVYMKGKWHEGIDYLQVVIPSGRDIFSDHDLEGRTVTLTMTDGLLFRKFTPPSQVSWWQTITDLNSCVIDLSIPYEVKDYEAPW